MQQWSCPRAMLGLVADVHSRAGGVVLFTRDMRVITCCPGAASCGLGPRESGGGNRLLPSLELFWEKTRLASASPRSGEYTPSQPSFGYLSRSSSRPAASHSPYRVDCRSHAAQTAHCRHGKKGGGKGQLFDSSSYESGEARGEGGAEGFLRPRSVVVGVLHSTPGQPRSSDPAIGGKKCGRVRAGVWIFCSR